MTFIHRAIVFLQHSVDHADHFTSLGPHLILVVAISALHAYHA
jgi:hypothetical protein